MFEVGWLEGRDEVALMMEFGWGIFFLGGDFRYFEPE